MSQLLEKVNYSWRLNKLTFQIENFGFRCVAKLQKADRSNLANARAGKWKLHNLLKGKIMEEFIML